MQLDKDVEPLGTGTPAKVERSAKPEGCRMSGGGLLSPSFAALVLFGVFFVLMALRVPIARGEALKLNVGDIAEARPADHRRGCEPCSSFAFLGGRRVGR